MLPPPAHPDLPLPQGSGPCLVYTLLQGSPGTHILTSAFQDLGRISVLPFILPRHSIHSPAKQQEAFTPVLLPYGNGSDRKHPFQKSTVVSPGLSSIPATATSNLENPEQEQETNFSPGNWRSKYTCHRIRHKGGRSTHHTLKKMVLQMRSTFWNTKSCVGTHYRTLFQSCVPDLESNFGVRLCICV